jgi:hypothetical protein
MLRKRGRLQAKKCNKSTNEQQQIQYIYICGSGSLFLADKGLKGDRKRRLERRLLVSVITISAAAVNEKPPLSYFQ